MASYHIRHVTTYRYRQPVAFGEHRLVLKPRDSHDQRTRRLDLRIEPTPRAVGWAEDASGNLSGSVVFGHRATQLSIVSESVVEQHADPPRPSDISDYARTLPFSYGTEEMPDLARFVERQFADAEHKLERWLRPILHAREGRDGRQVTTWEMATWEVDTWEVDTWEFLNRLNAAIRREFAYLRRDAKGIQPPAETLRLGRGTCRDFAVLMSEAVRSQGLAARFVSGYLHVGDEDPATSAGGATHAWLQVYLPGAGWVDFDPTSGTVGNEGLIRVALVRDPDRASPVSGTFIGFPSDYLGMSVQVGVVRAENDIRLQVDETGREADASTSE